MTYYKMILIGMIFLINILYYHQSIKAYKFFKGNILYTKIPYTLVDDEKIIEIRSRGKKKTRIFFILVSIFAIIASFFIDPVLILLLDILIIGINYPFLLQKDIDKMRMFKALNVKNQKDKKNIKYIDLSLIENRKKFEVKKIYYLLILLIYLLASGLAIYYEKNYPLLVWPFLGLVLMFSDYFTDKILTKQSIVTYTKNSEENIILNEKIAKKQGLILYIKSLINANLFLLLVIFSIKYPYSQLGFVLIIVLIGITTSISYYLYNRLNNMPILNKYYENIDDNIEYYNAWGYNNPNDFRLFVKKAYGVGNDINLAKVSGKIYYSLSMLLLLGLFIFSSYIFLTPMAYDYNLEKNNIKISSSQFYKDDIKIKDIKEINLLESLPEGKIIRVGGSAFENTSTGNYRIENYGSVRLYIYNDTKKVIEIKQKDKNFLINEKTEEDTVKLYEKMKDLIDK